MNKRMTYEAPATEQMEVRIEQNIMSVLSTSPADMTTHDSSDWGDWE